MWPRARPSPATGGKSDLKKLNTHAPEFRSRTFTDEGHPMTHIIIYEDPEATSPVQSRWTGRPCGLIQAQMAELFQVRPQNITIHLKNIFRDGGEEPATCKDFLQVQQEGSRKVQRSRKMYNLDVIISVGYRVNSRRGVRFRQWASSVLKDHQLKGYSLNRQRLGERELEEAQAALDLMSRDPCGQRAGGRHRPGRGRPDRAICQDLAATPAIR